MKPADNFDLRKFITENKLSSTNENETIKSIDNIGFQMYDDRIYQEWVDDMWEYLEKYRPGFSEQDVLEFLKYAQSSLAEEVDNNIQTYFHP
jgi:hypothetical protein